MPAKDIYHDTVKRALIRDGWKITHDPYTLTFGQRSVFVDLGAERIIAAEKANQQIAVEIKSFLSSSDIRDLEVAIGQFVFYRSLINRIEPERKLFLAVPREALISTFDEPIARPVVEDLSISLLAFDIKEEKVVQWVT